MPYTDPAKARAANQRSMAKRRAAASETKRTAEREADRKRKALEAAAAMPDASVHNLTDVAGRDFNVNDPGQLLHHGALTDVLTYNAGNESGGKPQRGTIVSSRVRRKANTPPSSTTSPRRLAARRGLELIYPGLSWGERQWAEYTLLALVWDPDPHPEQVRGAVEGARLIETGLFGLPPRVLTIAYAIRRFARGDSGISYAELQERTKFSDALLRRGLDDLRSVGLLLEQQDWGGPDVFYTIRGTRKLPQEVVRGPAQSPPHFV